jgi:adenine-specific DNA-methyltransferase
LRARLNAALTKTWQEWEIPREAGEPWPADVAELWAFARGENDPNEIRKAVFAINTALDRHYTPIHCPTRRTTPGRKSRPGCMMNGGAWR